MVPGAPVLVQKPSHLCSASYLSVEDLSAVLEKQHAVASVAWDV